MTTGPMATASTDGARSHARSQAGTAAMRVPATPDDIDATRLVWSESVPGGSYTSRVLGRGTRLRLVDPEGAACANLLLFRAEATWERLNVADTMKVPWQAYLSVGHPLLSDQGRVLATVVADSSGCHDMLCGMTPAAQASMLLAVTKHGMDVRDVAPSASFFHGVRAAGDGSCHYTGSAGPGGTVDLLIHLPVVVALVNSAHPLDPTAQTTPLDVLAWRADDELTTPVNTDPEYLRALFNTEATWACSHNSEALS
ncbi:MAG: urea carboxylase [Mycobacterium sp.]|nr:urea carboxylase [Mycobacterium sp.]